MKTPFFLPLVTVCLLLVGASSASSQLYQSLTFNVGLAQAVSQDLGNSAVTVNLRNDANEALNLVWIDQQGVPQPMFAIPARTEMPITTTPGHVFRIERQSGVIAANFQASAALIQNCRVDLSSFTPRTTTAATVSSQFTKLFVNPNLARSVSVNQASYRVQLNLKNEAAEPLNLVWIDQQGTPQIMFAIPARSQMPVDSVPGHVFRITRQTGIMVASFQVGTSVVQNYSVDLGPATTGTTSGTSSIVRNTAGPVYRKLFVSASLARSFSVTQENRRVQVNFKNDSNERLNLVWIDHQGGRQVIAPIPARGTHQEDPKPGYILRVERASGAVVGNLQVSRDAVQNYSIDAAAVAAAR